MPNFHFTTSGSAFTGCGGIYGRSRESVSLNGAMPVEGPSSSGASPFHGHGHGHGDTITGSSSAIMTTRTLVAGNTAPPLALLPADLPTEHIHHTQLQTPPTTDTNLSNNINPHNNATPNNTTISDLNFFARAYILVHRTINRRNSKVTV